MKAKKLTTFLLAAAMTAAATGSITVQAADNITVTVDGQKVVFDQPPVNINNRVMVPVRAVAEKMGWEVEYTYIYGNTLVNGQFQKEYYASMIKKLSDTDSSLFYNTNIWLATNKINGWCAGGSRAFDNFDRPLIANSTVINGRTLVGIRDMAEGLYADVQWDGKTKTVIIKTKPVSEYPHYNEIVQGAKEKANNSNNTQPSQPTTPVVQEPENQDREKKYIVDDEFFEEMIKVANAERAKVGAGELVIDDTLMAAAKLRAEECASMGELSQSHTRPNGQEFRTAIYEIDKSYSKKSTSEICASYTYKSTASGVIGIWMKSTKGHKEILLNSKWKYVGIGYDKTNDKSFAVMMFSD